MKIASNIVKEIGGRSELARALRVSVVTVDRYISEGKFPASWFDCMENMAGKPMPRHMFNFKAKGKTNGKS